MANNKPTGGLIPTISVNVVWPIVFNSNISIMESIEEVLTLIQKQYKRKDIYIFSVLAGNAELDRLKINDRVAIRYFSEVTKDTMHITFAIPVSKPTK